MYSSCSPESANQALWWENPELDESTGLQWLDLAGRHPCRILYTTWTDLKFLLALRLMLNPFFKNGDKMKGILYMPKLHLLKEGVGEDCVSPGPASSVRIHLLGVSVRCQNAREQPSTPASLLGLGLAPAPPQCPPCLVDTEHPPTLPGGAGMCGHLLQSLYHSCLQWLEFLRMLREHADVMIHHLGVILEKW